MERTKPGTYYGVTHSGRMIALSAPPEGHKPDCVICRRVADYPRATPPPQAAIGACAICDAPVAFNPKGPHQDVRRVCMQCVDVEPLPMEDPQ